MSASIDEINLAVRGLIRTVMGMPANSVRPAEQSAPAGGQTAEIATVKIITSDDLGWPNDSLANSTDPTMVTASSEFLTEVVASINFYRSPSKNPAGIATYSNEAFTRATVLARRLQLPGALDAMLAMGIGLIDVGKPRNLAAIADATWESRGQVDVTFAIVNQESVELAAIASTEIDVTAQVASGSQQLTIEVTT